MLKKAFEVATKVYRCEKYSDLVDCLNHGLKVYLVLGTEEKACQCVNVKRGVEVINHLGKHVQFLTEEDFFEGITAAYAVEKTTTETTEEGYQLLFDLATDYESGEKLNFLVGILN